MTKKWTIKAGDGTKVDFFPIFEADKEDGEIRCQAIRIKIKDKEYTFNFINIFQFIYFVANEELRRGLLQRYQRQAYNIPYDITFKLSPDEQRDGMARRKINVTVNELAMAIARNEAFKMMPYVMRKLESGTKPRDLFKGRSK